MNKFIAVILCFLPFFLFAQADTSGVDTTDMGYKIGYHITNTLHYALYAGVAIYLVFAIRKFTRNKGKALDQE